MCQKFKNDPLVAVLINKICAAQVKVLITVSLYLYFFVSLSAKFHELLVLLSKTLMAPCTKWLPVASTSI